MGAGAALVNPTKRMELCQACPAAMATSGIAGRCERVPREPSPMIDTTFPSSARLWHRASWRQEEALTTEGRGSQAKALARGWPEQERKGSRGAGVGVLPQHATTWRRGHQGRERRRGAGSSGVTARGLGGA